MKTLFIEARKKFNESDIILNLLDKIEGKTISLAGTVQYLGILPKIKNYLESKSKEVKIKKGAFYDGHVLGCNSSAFDKNADTLLLITDGKFHATNNAIQLQKEIYVFNGKVLEKVDQKDLDEHNKKTLAKKSKFLNSNTVGLLISSKLGQHQKNYSKIKKQIENLGKKVYVFESDNINSSEFENFPTIPIWVNTACFGLARDDKRIINFSDILEFLKLKF